jgi:hypothetical protein
MKKKFLLSFALSLFGWFLPEAAAQTTVTGTVLDPSGVPYASATVNVTLVAPSGGASPVVTSSGAPVVMPLPATTSASGTFSIVLLANSLITPSSTTYTVRVCSPVLPPPLGSGNSCVTISGVTISGSSQDLSTTFAAVPPPALIVPAGTLRAATFAATAQAANISAATGQLLVAPANVTGTYRLVCYIVETQAATTSSTLPACNVVFTDNDSGTAETVALTTTSAANAVGTLGANATTAIVGFQAKPGTNIQVSTSGYASSGATAMQYAIHAKLEFIGAP